MPGQVTVVLGPARGGKTTRLVGHYRAALAAGPPGSAMWITPTQRSVDPVRRQLLAAEIEGCVRPGVMTFGRLVDSVLAASEHSIRPLSEMAKRRLIRRLLDEANAAGRLVHFRPIAHTAGLVDLIAAWISEWKRLEIWPQEFEAAAAERSTSIKDRELIEIYTAYQQRLTDHELYDAEGRFWTARELLREGQLRPLEHLRLVVVDGFTDFTRTQHEILEILAERVDQVFISLPAEQQPIRRDLFAKSRKTLDELVSRHAGLETITTPRPERPPWGAIAHVERQLFQNPRRRAPAADASGIEILSASSPAGELRLIGKRIKSLILRGDPLAGAAAVPPEQIAVVFRSLDSAPLVREVFGAMGVPMVVEAAPRLNEAPLLAALTGLLRLVHDDWPFRRLLAVLSNNFLRPTWPEWDDERTVEIVERFVRRLNVPTGRQVLLTEAERLVKAAERAVDESAAPPAEDGQTLADLAAERAHALAMLRLLAAALDRLPRQATPAAWAEAIEQLAVELGMVRTAETAANRDPLAARDQAAWSRLGDAFEDCDRLAKLLGEPADVLDLRGAIDLLVEMGRTLDLPLDEDETGCVQVLTAQSARSLDIPYLFLAGLSESAFPPPMRDDRIYTEAESGRLAAAGLPLVLRAERGCEEMLLFYTVVTRATKRLYLSYPGLDGKAEPLLPSPYLSELEQACGAGRIARVESPDLSPIARGSEPASAADLRVTAVDAALAGEPRQLAALLRAPASAVTARGILSGVAAIGARATHGEFGAYDGVIADPKIHGQLQRRFGADHFWSPSELEQYAACPHRFFLERVLGVEPLGDAELAIDPARQGALLHDALATLHRGVNATHAGPTSPAGLDEAAFGETCDRIVRELLFSEHERGALSSALAEIQRRALGRLLAAYHGQESTYHRRFSDEAAASLPAHFEVAFGPLRPGERAEERRDPLSTERALEFADGEQTIRIAGRIDRIDLAVQAGRTLFSIVDYKSGQAPRASDVAAGRDLQLALYAMAAEEVLLADQQAVGREIGYWAVARKGYGRALRLSQVLDGDIVETPAWQELRGLIRDRILRLARGVQKGQFPMHSADPKCTGYCEFHTVCRVNHARALEKSWSPPTSDPN